MFSPEIQGVLRRVAEMSAKGDFSFVTAAEGQDLAQAGYIQIDPNVIHPENPAAFGATITVQGSDYLKAISQPAQAASAIQMPQMPQMPQAPQAPQAPQPNPQPTVAQVQVSQSANGEASDPVFEVSTSHARPVKPKSSRGNSFAGRKSKYPYEQLQINTSFFVADTDVESGDAYKTMSSSVAAMNKKFRENKIVGYNSDGTAIFQPLLKDGQPIFDSKGKQRFYQINTKRFRCYKIDKITETEPKLGARIFREPLNDSDGHGVAKQEAPVAVVSPFPTA